MGGVRGRMMSSYTTVNETNIMLTCEAQCEEEV